MNMLDWSASANAAELFGGAVVQVLVVLLTAVLTWAISARMESRRAVEAARDKYRAQIEAYSDDLHSVAGMLDDVAEQHGVITAEQVRRYERFADRTSWVPSREDLAVDSWMKSAMSRVVSRIMQYGNDDAWDAASENSVREDLWHELNDFNEWVGGLKPASEFRERLENSNMRVWNARFGDPLSHPRSRFARLRAALRESAYSLQRAWTGRPS